MDSPSLLFHKEWLFGETSFTASSNYTEERVYRGELEDNIFILWEHQEEFGDAFTLDPMKLRRYGYKQLLKRYPWLEFAIFEEAGTQYNI